MPILCVVRATQKKHQTDQVQTSKRNAMVIGLNIFIRLVDLVEDIERKHTKTNRLKTPNLKKTITKRKNGKCDHFLNTLHWQEAFIWTIRLNTLLFRFAVSNCFCHDSTTLQIGSKLKTFLLNIDKQCKTSLKISIYHIKTKSSN